MYWMQASVRVHGNLALAEAASWARSLGQPLAVVFCLDASFPEANARHFAFLLDGLADVADALASRGWALTVLRGSPTEVLPRAVAGASGVVFDKGYLPVQRRWRQRLAEVLEVPVLEVEDNLIVPVEAVSDHDEWAAATLRPKLMRQASLEALPPPGEPRLADARGASDYGDRCQRLGLDVLPGRPSRAWLGELGVSSTVGPTPLVGGEAAALARWKAFASEGLETYDRDRNDPNLSGSSGLAPYLHFGHLSPLTLVADLRAQGRWVEAVSYRRALEDPVSKFLDEVLVRRELAANFVWFNADFARFAGLPEWSRRSLANHALDRREHVYTAEQWEAAATHDEVWNACQRVLAETGVLHGYLRMYWGKKLLEWSADPAEALALALRLNNAYALDGRDPNSYAGVAWCFGKHDRPWGERPVYGLVRCMTSGGLARKFDVARWVASVTRPRSPAPLQPELPI